MSDNLLGLTGIESRFKLRKKNVLDDIQRSTLSTSKCVVAGVNHAATLATLLFFTSP